MNNKLNRIEMGVKRLLILVQQLQPSISGDIHEEENAEYLKSMDAGKLLSAQEVQAKLQITHSTYYRWIARGILQPIHIGGKHYYEKEEIQKLFKNRGYRLRGGFSGHLST